MASLSAGDLTKLRTGQFASTPYLSVLQPATILSATVDGAHNRGARSIAYTGGTGSAAEFALIGEGQTLEVDTDDGTKKVRVKSITGDESSGTITVDENGIVWGAGDSIRIKFEYRIWPVFPRISGGIFYKYYDLAYSDQNTQPPPVAIAGPHQAAFLPADTTGTIAAQVSASGDDGYATSAGAFDNTGTTGIVGKLIGVTSYSSWIRVAAAIPQGATITSAVIDFVAGANSSATNAVIAIAAEDADNPTAPVSQADFAGRARTTAVTAWLPGAWTAGTPVQSPDISTVIQEVVDRPGFVSGNAIQIFLDDNGSSSAASRRFTTYNGNPGRAAILRVSYTVKASVTLDLDASNSYAVAQGATISSYAWACTGGTIDDDTAATTTITFDTAGQYWLTLTVTDSNGKTQTTHRAIFIYDADNQPYRDFTVTGVTGSWQGGGWRFGIRATGNVTLADFPDGALCLLWYEGKINGSEDYVNLWGVGDNVICSGYIRTDNDGDDFSSGAGVIEFSAVTPESLLDEMTEFGTISITATAMPTTWYEYASWLTVGRAVHHLLRWHSTAFSCVDIYGLTDNVLGMQQANFTETSLLQQVNALGFQRGHFAKMVSDRLGRLFFVTDSQYLNDAGRGGLDTVFSLTASDISGEINVTRQPEGRIGAVVLDGFAFDGSTATPYISICPGYIDGISIPVSEFRGAGTQPIKSQVLASQTDSNEKTGRVLAVNNNPYNDFHLSTRGNYLGAFDIVPLIGWYEWGLPDADLKRELELNGANLICRAVEQQVDTQTGTIKTTVTFEVEAIGPDGIPGNYPTTYPTATQAPAPEWAGGGDALMVFSSASYRDDNDSDWTELQITDYAYGGKDAWWKTTQGDNPADVIWFGLAVGAVYRAVGISGTPVNVIPANDPPNTHSDTTAPTAAGLTPVQFLSDPFVQGRHFVLYGWQEPSGSLWRGWIAATVNDGASWSWLELYDGLTLPDQIKPGWMAVNGTNLMVTIWADEGTDVLRLVVFDSNLAYDTEFDLGAASLTEVNDKTYTAFPVTVLDDDALWFVAGRMNAPQTLANPEHIISTADSGANWVSVENGLGTSYVAALEAGLDNSGRLLSAVVFSSGSGALSAGFSDIFDTDAGFIDYSWQFAKVGDTSAYVFTNKADLTTWDKVLYTVGSGFGAPVDLSGTSGINSVLDNFYNGEWPAGTASGFLYMTSPDRLAFNLAGDGDTIKNFVTVSPFLIPSLLGGNHGVAVKGANLYVVNDYTIADPSSDVDTYANFFTGSGIVTQRYLHRTAVDEIVGVYVTVAPANTYGYLVEFDVSYVPTLGSEVALGSGVVSVDLVKVSATNFWLFYKSAEAVTHTGYMVQMAISAGTVTWGAPVEVYTSSSGAEKHYKRLRYLSGNLAVALYSQEVAATYYIRAILVDLGTGETGTPVELYAGTDSAIISSVTGWDLVKLTDSKILAAYYKPNDGTGYYEKTITELNFS